MGDTHMKAHIAQTHVSVCLWNIVAHAPRVCVPRWIHSDECHEREGERERERERERDAFIHIHSSTKPANHSRRKFSKKSMRYKMYHVCTKTSLLPQHQQSTAGRNSQESQLAICTTGWRRLIGSPKLQIIFHKRAIKYRSLVRKMTYKDKGSYESSPPCM